MFELFGKIAPMLFRTNPMTRGVNTLARETFAALAAKTLKWELPKNLPPYSKVIYSRKDYTIELGNFPEDSLYILRKNGQQIYKFDSLPDKWIFPRAANTTAPKNKPI